MFILPEMYYFFSHFVLTIQFDRVSENRKRVPGSEWLGVKPCRATDENRAE